LEDLSKKLAVAEAQMQAMNKTHAASLLAQRDEIEAGVGRESSLKADWEGLQKELLASKRELDMALLSHNAVKVQLSSHTNELKSSLATQTAYGEEQEQQKKRWMSEKLALDQVLEDKDIEMQALKHTIAQQQQQIFDLTTQLAEQTKLLQSANAALAHLQEARQTWSLFSKVLLQLELQCE
jgi:hypothetical protein